MIVNLRILVAACVLAAPACAFADATISYRSEGGCAGDFDSVQLKDYYLRADAEQGGGIDHGVGLRAHVQCLTDGHEFSQSVRRRAGSRNAVLAGFPS